MTNNLTRQLVISIFLLFPTFVYAFVRLDSLVSNKLMLDYLEESGELNLLNPDSSILFHRISFDQSMQNGDTLAAILDLVVLGQLYAHGADFGQSYDTYWEGLLLADKLGDVGARAVMYDGLAWLYSLYQRREKAIEYFNMSQDILKKLVLEKDLNGHVLLDIYYALAILHRKEKNSSISRRYLDSCRFVQDKTGNKFIPSNAYIKAEMGYLAYQDGDYKSALELLQEPRDYFENHQRAYLVILYSFLGDIYRAMGEYTSSEKFYLSAIEISERYKSHFDLVPDIHEHLSGLYLELNRPQPAYEHLKRSKTLDEAYFGGRSKANTQLLEIKDEFRMEKEKQNNLIREQRMARLEHENEISYLQTIILIGTIVFLVLFGFLLYRHLRTRYKAEKKLMRQQQELEMQKTREVLSIKNKELTKSALQVIEMEEMLSDLKVRLKEQKKNPDSNELHKLIKSIDVNTSTHWKEFEARFIAVNKSFYKHLRKRFPNLNQSDHRLCALVKLNFSSKDMSRLLGISVESVHTSRYRLRKKLGLDKNANLGDFISKL